MSARRACSLSVVVLAFASAAAASPAQAAVRNCNVRVQAPNRTLENAGVNSARNMSCRAARRAIRRNGTQRKSAPYGDAGARFRLGPWSCSVYYHNYELWKARCTRGGKAFRVEYGV